MSSAASAPAAVPAPRTVSRERLFALVGVAVFCALAFVAVYLLAQTDTGRRIDDVAVNGGAVIGSRQFGAANHLLNAITTTSLAVIIVALVGVAVARRRPWLALCAAISIGGAVSLAQLMKRTLPQTDLAHYLDGLRFPSGHATIALSVGLAAVLIAPATRRRPVAIVAVLFAAAVGICAVAAGWHRASDVAGGFLLATGWTAAVAAVTLAASPHELGREHREVHSAGLHRFALALPVVAILIVVAGVGAAIIGHDAGRLRFIDVTPNFVAVAAGIAALATLSVAALVGSLGVLRDRVAPPL